MNQATYLNNQFIIAMPGLADPNFFHTVTFLCQHNEEGALGIVINRPAEMTLGEIFKQMKMRVTSTLRCRNTRFWQADRCSRIAVLYYTPLVEIGTPVWLFQNQFP